MHEKDEAEDRVWRAIHDRETFWAAVLVVTAYAFALVFALAKGEPTKRADACEFREVAQ